MPCECGLIGPGQHAGVEDIVWVACICRHTSCVLIFLFIVRLQALSSECKSICKKQQPAGRCLCGAEEQEEKDEGAAKDSVGLRCQRGNREAAGCL
jgi:hypothetical protein